MAGPRTADADEAYADESRDPLSLSDYYDRPLVSEVAVSPDDDRLAFLAGREADAAPRAGTSKPGDDAASLLVTAGGEDRRCPPGQAERLYVSVTKRGVPAKLAVYPETAHDRGGPTVETHRIETVTDRFRRHDPAVEDDDAE